MSSSRQRFLAALNGQQPDFQSGFERGMSGMTALLSGAGHIGAQSIVGADQGASYIADEHTARHMRTTYWRASIFNQASWDAWMADGGKDAYARAHEKVEAILSRHYPPQPLVSPQVIQTLDDLMAEAQAHPERFSL
jgi:trimethylamine:corrinoid methyltransferase-like protein